MTPRLRVREIDMYHTVGSKHSSAVHIPPSQWTMGGLKITAHFIIQKKRLSNKDIVLVVVSHHDDVTQHPPPNSFPLPSPPLPAAVEHEGAEINTILRHA